MSSAHITRGGTDERSGTTENHAELEKENSQQPGIVRNFLKSTRSSSQDQELKHFQGGDIIKVVQKSLANVEIPLEFQETSLAFLGSTTLEDTEPNKKSILEAKRSEETEACSETLCPSSQNLENVQPSQDTEPEKGNSNNAEPSSDLSPPIFQEQSLHLELTTNLEANKPGSIKPAPNMSSSPSILQVPFTPLQTQFTEEEEPCGIYYSTLTTPCTLYPCRHFFGLTCFLARFDICLEDYDSFVNPPPEDIILTCPFCKQAVTSVLETDSKTTRDKEYIFNIAREMKYARLTLQPDDPVDERCLHRFQNVEVGWGWMGVLFWRRRRLHPLSKPRDNCSRTHSTRSSSRIPSDQGA